MILSGHPYLPADLVRTRLEELARVGGD
jgi:hypothetical protein